MCSLLLGQQDPPYVHMLDACIGFLGLCKLLYSTTGVAICQLARNQGQAAGSSGTGGRSEKESRYELVIIYVADQDYGPATAVEMRVCQSAEPKGRKGVGDQQQAHAWSSGDSLLGSGIFEGGCIARVAPKVFDPDHMLRRAVFD